MNDIYEGPHVGILAARWWLLVLRGVATMLFGMLSILVPEISLFALVLLWGLFAIVDGVANLALAARGGPARRWGWLVFAGVVSIAAGLLTWIWPAVTTFFLLGVIAFWAVFTGVAEIASAIRLRKQITGEWLLVASGILSVLFGVLMIAFPSAGALAMVWLIGIYAIVLGALLFGLGMELRRWGWSHEQEILSGGTPTAV